MRGRVSGKVAAVTGAGSGIGRELALGLVARGARVAVSDVDQAGLDETVALLRVAGAEVHAALVDVSDQGAVAAWASDVVAHFGVVHQVYNNAGIAPPMAPVADTPYATYAKVLAINLGGVLHGTKEFLPHLIASGDGHVVNLSSLNGFAAQPNLSPYVTSKFAVRGFTENLRSEMIRGKYPVRVTVVLPGGVATNIASAAASPAQRELAEPLVADAAGNVDPAKVIELERQAAAYNKALLKTPADVAAKGILDGVERGRPRIKISQATYLDWLVRLLPADYVRVMVEADRRVFGRSG